MACTDSITGSIFIRFATIRKVSAIRRKNIFCPFDRTRKIDSTPEAKIEGKSVCCKNYGSQNIKPVLGSSDFEIIFGRYQPNRILNKSRIRIGSKASE